MALHYQPVTSSTPVYGTHRNDVFIVNRDRLLRKDHLLQTFTPASKSVLYIPVEMLKHELITLTVDYSQELDEILESGRLFAVPKRQPLTALENILAEKDIEFYTGRSLFHMAFSKEDKFSIGSRYTFPWGDYAITSIRQYRHINKYPGNTTEIPPARIANLKDESIQIVTFSQVTIDRFEQLPPSDNVCIYGVAKIVSDTEVLLYRVQEQGSVSAYHIHEPMDIAKGYIDNYTGSRLSTTYGLYLLNYTVLVLPLGTAIPYINSEPGTSDFNLGKIDSRVAELLMEGILTRENYDKYMQYGYFIGHMAQLGVMGLTEKALTTDPQIAIRKKELLELHKDELDDPIVLTRIENELVEMDKAWLRDDPSYDRYYGINPNKAFNEHRKKMFITMGIAPAFSKDENKYEFTESSLASGIKPKDMVNVSNEIRRGIYDRGLGTAKGGEQTKFILRVFNATSIESDDCKSPKGLVTTITDNNKNQFSERYMVDPNTGKTTLLTKDVLDKLVGKTIQLRSPMYCRTKDGLCYTCVGENFRTLDRKNIGMMAVFIGSTFTSINMKSMHFSGIKSDKIDDFTKYFIV